MTVARVKMIKPEEADAETRKVYDGVVEQWGRISNFSQVLAHQPAALAGWMLPNESIRLEGYRAVPRNAKEDAFLREWITRQRRGNDPERWHGDTPGLRDLQCPYCERGVFRNQDVYEDHLQIKHLREEMGDERMR